MPDHIPMLSMPPRCSIAITIGYLKGKSVTRIHRELLHTKGTLFGRSFWARGYCVSTVGLDEEQIRRSLKHSNEFQVCCRAKSRVNPLLQKFLKIQIPRD